ncbi:MAG TPA: hypothetical protein VMW63_10590 [Methanoregulaceae archaeon]|nr:hypothetical protein [Methanoregulaceae archaeon]
MNGKNGESAKNCPVFGVESGIPPIGLGILLLLFAIVPFFIHGIPAPPLPVIAILIMSGAVFIWMGIYR